MCSSTMPASSTSRSWPRFTRSKWTPGILATPTLRKAIRGNWWGALDEQFYRRYGRVGSSEIVSGILGTPTDHQRALYAMTEEFTAVYRMHPLIPDDFSLRSHHDDQLVRAYTSRDLAFTKARTQVNELGLSDLLYSFGTMHPGAITLHNFPRFLQTLEKEGSERFTDLGAVNILQQPRAASALQRFPSYAAQAARGELRAVDA